MEFLQIIISDTFKTGRLNVRNMNLTSDELCTILDYMPDTLIEINIFNNKITNLPFSLCSMFPFLEILDCGQNKLTSLPILPRSLIQLRCHGNMGITKLPDLPSTLTVLDCWLCNLTALPPLPEGLLELDCAHNRLTTLPTIPKSLEIITYNYNSLGFLNSPTIDDLHAMERLKEAGRNILPLVHPLSEQNPIGLNDDVMSVIASFLTDKRGLIQTQLNQLKRSYLTLCGHSKG
jgi:Leucine-rich repeat (LRR) protein